MQDTAPAGDIAECRLMIRFVRQATVMFQKEMKSYGP